MTNPQHHPVSLSDNRRRAFACDVGLIGSYKAERHGLIGRTPDKAFTVGLPKPRKAKKMGMIEAKKSATRVCVCAYTEW